MEFDVFAERMKELGYDQIIERVWKPLTTFDEHSHPFDANALIVQGEMWLTLDGRTEHLLPGGTFELGAHKPHSEHYGAEGATYRVARRTLGPS